MRIQGAILTNQTVLFLATLGVALSVAWHAGSGVLSSPGLIQPLEFSWTDGLLILFFFLLFSFILARVRVVSGWVLKFFLTLLVIVGTQLFTEPWLSPLAQLVVGVGVAGIFWLWRRVGVHNAALVLAIGGVAGMMGAGLPPLTVIFVLIVFSIYDIVAVYRTRHMVAMANSMLSSGVIIGFLIPARVLDFSTRTAEALARRDHMILGSGDSGLPALLVASTLFYGSWEQALTVSVCVLLGAFLMHVIFMNQQERAPMAALPPIATLAILGYLLSVVIF